MAGFYEVRLKVRDDEQDAMQVLSRVKAISGVDRHRLTVSRVYPIVRNQEMLMRAREAFMKDEPYDFSLIDPIILQSWQRVKSDGDVRDGIADPTVLSGEKLQDRILQRIDLFDAAKPFFDILEDLVSNLTPVFVIMIADENGYLLDVRTDGQTAPHALNNYFVKGALYAESNVGNNPIGTALRVRKPVVISGAEHYNTMFDGWTGLGAPILGLVGEVKGAIGVVVPNEYAVSHLVTIMRAMSRGIEAHTNKLTLQQQLVMKQRDYDRVTQKAIADYEKMDVGAMLVNDELTIVLWNRAAETITGVRKNQILGRTVYQAFPDIPETARLIEDFLNSDSAELKNQIIRARFQGRDFLLTLNIELTSERTAVVTFREVGRFENKEQALQLFDHLPFGMLLSDANDRVVFVNRAWSDLSGLGPEFVLGRTRRELAVHTQLIDIPDRNDPVRPVMRLIRLSIGEIRPFLIEHHLLDGPNGKSTLTIFEDAERLSSEFFGKNHPRGDVSVIASKEQVPVSIHWREIRKMLGFNQSEFSQRVLGVNPGQYLMYEKGAKFPSLPNTLKFARKCGVPVEFIYRLLDERPES